MNSKRVAIAIAIAVAVLAISVPISISLYLARQESIAEQKSRVSQLANDVLRRADTSNNQMAYAFDTLNAAVSKTPCSDEAVALMARIAVESEEVQGFGYVSENRLLCSSLGRYTEGIAVGPPDFQSAKGIDFRTSVELPSIANVKFILITNATTGFSAIVHPKLPLDVFTNDPDLTVGIVGYSEKKLIDLRGRYDPRWLMSLAAGEERQLFNGDNVVAIKRSRLGDYAAFAALPAIHVTSGLHRLALVLTPIGAVAGLVLAFALLRVARLQLALPAVIKSALKRHEFFLEYQPVVDLRTGAWAGAEALLRWRRPSGEMVRPDMFIPVAEEAGLITRVTERVLELIGKDAAGLFARHPDFHIAVNLSAADLGNPELQAMLKRLVERTGGRPGNFIVEVTERGLVKGSAVKDLLNDIRATGMEVAIDDFGTGYSSLSYLESFDLDYLKIDKSFVDTIGVEAATSQVVSHIVEMAKGLKLEMIAEGIETEAQLQFLRDREVRYGQGWLFARAMAMDDLRARLKTAGSA